ncbi:MAG: 16S rRNA (cytosine(1402)-N(4))-methyltransferase RsmH [Kofleriaceae bacterium]
MTAFDHATVLAVETVDQLDVRNDCVYVDGTLGGAGHAAQILERAPRATLIGIDRDPTALDAARERLAPFGDRVRLVHGQYADLPSILPTLGRSTVDGILLDLGVSSPQLDHADRGFSFMKEGPLDMRMDPTRGPTALELLRELSVDELGDVIKDLGEERYGHKIARLIKDAVRDDQLRTTTDLAALISKAIPFAEQRKSKIHPATRTFQGLRIAVNRELDELDRILDAFPDLLNPGGRCAIISFHSLEDRRVKNRFRDLAWTSSLPPKLAIQEGERVDAVCELLSRKALVATDDEIARNPRSRSARLRACVRTSAPNVAATRHPRGAGRYRVE